MMWSIHWTLPQEYREGVLYTACREGEEVLSLRGEQQGVKVRQYTRQADKTCCYELYSPVWPREAVLEWREACVALYADGQLADEDWPLGQTADRPWQEQGELVAHWQQGVEAHPEQESSFSGPIQFFVPSGHNTGVGDCMPFFRNGRYCLYYLFDRRGHASKGGLGAHQWAQISSGDLKTWTVHPMALSIDEQWEGSICTGSLLESKGLFYAFYAVRMSDGSPARLSWAVSTDGVHFEKSGRYFSLKEPFEPRSARDPMVFFGADGQYHMLVTTSRMDRPGPYNGCLAHLTSLDLENWTQQKAPFIEPGYPGQPECADYFEWNGWYYLVFSYYATAYYRISRHPFGPWQRPAQDVLDNRHVSVPKTAPFGDRRLVSGFMRRDGYRGYAGLAITHELFQRPDGTLGVRQCEEILPCYAAREQIDCRVEALQERAQKLLFSAKCFRLKGQLIPSENAMFGLVLSLGEQAMTLRFDAGRCLLDLLSLGQEYPDNYRQRLSGLDFARLEFDLVVGERAIDLVFSDGNSMSMPLPAHEQVQVSLFAHWGEVEARLTCLR